MSCKYASRCVSLERRDRRCINLSELTCVVVNRKCLPLRAKDLTQTSNLDGPVISAGAQNLAVQREDELGDAFAVFRENSQAGPVLYVPQAHCPVLVARCKISTIRREGRDVDPVDVCLQG